MSYACEVLDALAWRWGPAHMELKTTPQGVRLVEANVGRFNGLDFKLLADLCFGANAFDLGVQTFLSPRAFAKLPAAPPSQLACHARLVTLVSSVEGTLDRVGHGSALEQLPSLVSFAPEPAEAGEPVRKTVDLNTAAGYAHLLHQDKAVVEADYAELRRLQPDLFEVA